MQPALRTTLSVTLPCGCEISRETITSDQSLTVGEQLKRQASIAADRVARRIPQHSCDTKEADQ